jgi:hypothetical protein
VRAPLKYRSLRLTGKEKRLGELAKTGLFGRGRLNLDLLGCYADVPPLAHEAINELPSVIVFENADSFTVAREVLKGLARSPFGMVAFGGGNGIARSLPFLKMIGRPLEEVHYVGDLDYHGLKIAQRAVRAALQMEIPIKPATSLHRAMLASASAFGCPDGWPIGDQSPPKLETVRKVIDFLDVGISARVSSILVKGNRIPEEVLGPGELTALWA